MKNSISKCIVFILFFSLTSSVFAQTNNNTQMYLVHEDFVKPSMAVQYETIGKNFKNALDKHQVKNFDYNTFSTSDFRYIYLVPIANMAQLDDNSGWQEIETKMGKNEFDKMFENFAKCYTNHGDYILTLDKDLSYQPNGINTNPQGKPYRKITMYYYAPENAKNMEAIAKEFKSLYTKKNSKAEYRIYKSGFGSKESFYMVAVASENPYEYEKFRVENNKVVGDDVKPLFDRLMKNVTKVETMQGYMRPEMSYKAK